MSGAVLYAAGTAYPYYLHVGQAGRDTAARTNITSGVDLTTIRLEDVGTRESATFTFEYKDSSLSSTELVPEGKVRFSKATGAVLFTGYVRQLRIRVEGITRLYAATCYDIGTLLDRLIIDPPASRKNGESDKARIKWLLATYGQQFLHDGSSDFSKIQQLRGSMPDQRFGNQTLRQAIERVLGEASDSSYYYVDPMGRLHTFDDPTPETFAAPFDVKVTASPAATEVVPEALEIEWDTQPLIDYYKVRGKNANGSVRRSDATAIHDYGLRQAYVDAPDADTVAKGERVGDAALRDTKAPVVRGSFALSGEDVCQTAGGYRWQSGQTVSVTSTYHGLLAKTFRIVRVTTTFLSGTGQRRVEVEFGGMRRRLTRTGAA